MPARLSAAGLSPMLGDFPATRESCGGVRAAAIQREQARDAGRHERDDELVEALELATGELGSLYQHTQCASGVVAGDVAGAGRSDASSPTRSAAVCLAEWPRRS